MTTAKTIIQWWYLYASYAGITTVFIIMLGIVSWRKERMKKVIFVVFVAVFLLALLNLFFGLRQFFSWPNINVFDVDFWLSFITILFYGKFLQLIKKVFGKVSFRKLPEIVWSFVKIIPSFLRQIFPILKKLWREQSDKGGQ